MENGAKLALIDHPNSGMHVQSRVFESRLHAKLVALGATNSELLTMSTRRGEDHRSGRNMSRRDYNEDANYPGGRVPAAEEGAESQEHGGSGTGQAGGYTGSIARMRSQGTQLTGEGSSERCKRCDSTGTRLPPKALGTDSLLTSWLFAEFSAGEMEKIVQSCTASTVGGCTRRHHWGGGIHINGRLMADAP